MVNVCWDISSSQEQCDLTGVSPIMNGDFDHSPAIQSTLWSRHSGISVQTTCTTETGSAVLSGNVAVFGGTADNTRYITSKAISLQKAQVILFDAVVCPWPGTIPTISAALEYSIDNGSAYGTLQSFTMNKGDGGVHLVVNVNASMRALSTPFHLRIRQTSHNSGKGIGVWVLDNFSVLGTSPEYVSDDFDPTLSCYWLAHTGTVKPLNSSGNAMTFSGIPVSSDGHFVTSIPLAMQGSGRVSSSAKVLFEENFDPIPSIPGNNWARFYGGKIVTPSCGSIDSFGAGFAAFFNESGSRYIQTQPLDLTNAQTLSFKIRIGGGGGCDGAESGEDVVVEYQLVRYSSFTELRKMAYNESTSARDVAISLPVKAKNANTVLQWRQISHSGRWNEVWVLDKIQITNAIPTPTTIFSEHFDSWQPVPGLNWQSFSGGRFTTPYCGSIADAGLGSTAAFFDWTGDRSITTQPLDLTNAITLNFRVRLDGTMCGRIPYGNGEDVVVEYKQADTNYRQLTSLAYFDYSAATTVTIALPSDALATGTTLRWRQLNNTGVSSGRWALDDITVTGIDQVASTASYVIIEDFSSTSSIPGTIWQTISGGSIRTPDCGSIDLPGFSSEAAFFYSSGSRYIATVGLDLHSGGVLSFRIRIGGGSGCETADDIGEDVVLEYMSGLSSSTYVELKRMAYNRYSAAQAVSVTIPTSAKTSNTVLRWRQLGHDGATTDEWAIDHVRLSNDRDVSLFGDNFDTASIPGTWWAAISGGTFTTPDCGSIDLVGYSSRAAFFSLTGTRYIRTQRLDLTMARTLSFRVQIGGRPGSDCETADIGEDVVVEYQPDGSSTFSQLLVLAYYQYLNATTVTVTLPTAALTTSTALQWKQTDNSGQDFDEWAVDHVSITGRQYQRVIVFSEGFDRLPRFPGSKWQLISGGNITAPDCGIAPGYSKLVAFFSGHSSSRHIQTVGLDLTMANFVFFHLLIGGGNCETADSGEDVVLEYRTSGASSFTRLQLFSHDSYDKLFFQPVSVTLTAASKTPSTVLRWRQMRHTGKGYDEWAIDHIQINSTQEIETMDTIPPLFAEDFYPIPTFPGSKWLNLTGGTVRVPDCGGIDLTGYSAQAAFFSLSGPRFIQTHYLDLRAARSLSFVVQIGGLSGCEDANPGEDIVVEYQAQGSSSVTSILSLRHDAFKTATAITVTLPPSSRTKATSLRWRQLDHDGIEYDEWAIDHIRITGWAYGRQQVVNFQLLIAASSTQANWDVRLEYSADFGQTWALAQPDCLPSSSQCTQTLLNSQYQSVLFSTWKRVTVLLPFFALSSHTQIRWRQPSTASGNYWAIDNVYCGVQCPNFCSGHGRCINTTGQYEGVVCGGNSDGQPCASSFIYRNKIYTGCTRDGREAIDNELWCSTTANYDKDKMWGYCICGACKCDPGYSGKSCATVTKTMPRFLKEDFESNLSSSKWAWVSGGMVATTCGTVASKKSMVLNVGRSRLLETIDLDLTQGTTVQFTVRVGSTISGCPQPSDNTENVFLQYSTNGGVTWVLLLTIQYNMSPSLTSYNLTFPSASKTRSTRIRWYQPIANGSDLDVWAIDDVSINSVASSLPCAGSPCLNQGICINEMDGTYSCQRCYSNPCLNGGSCADYPTMFRCSCVQGFTGEICETDIDGCSTDPCKNSANCHDLINDYHCDCVVGYSGKNCTQYTGACGSGPCQNQAICNDLTNGNFLCACSDKFNGTLCESRSDKSSGGISVGVYAASVVVLIVCLLVAVIWIYKQRKVRQGVAASNVETVSELQNSQESPAYGLVEVVASGHKVDTETKQHTDPPIASNVYENDSPSRPFGVRYSTRTPEQAVYEVIK